VNFDDDRIVFLVHEPSLWAHYATVWARLPAGSFVIALGRRFRATAEKPPATGATDFLARVDRLGYSRVWAEEARREGRRFKLVVSNHKIGGDGLSAAPFVSRLVRGLTDRGRQAAALVLRRRGRPAPLREWAPRPYWPLQLGALQVRFMYGADVGDGWSLAEWNAMYHAFLCHGPNDQQQIAARFPGRTFQMGYPRYDPYFDPALDAAEERRQFVRKPDARTVLWMPTFGEGACSLPHFAAALKPLQQRYNFIVRPHPLSFREAPQDIALLKSLGYMIDDDPLRDMNRLYRIVDAMLCDYGGSAFGALYLDKPMLLLDVPGSSDWYTVRNSSNLELARHYPSVTPGDAGAVSALLEDEAAWAARAAPAHALRSRYFADLRGTSSARAAAILTSLREDRTPPPLGDA
jgi:hypothetical protein